MMTEAPVRLPDDVVPIVRPTLEPPPRLLPSQWAAANRDLPEDLAAEPGRWRNERTPYLAEVMDAFADREVSRITFVKSGQVGGTEAANNMILWAMDVQPGIILYVLPTEEDAADECTGRLATMIASCRRMDRYITHDGWATRHQISLRGKRKIKMAWAAAPRTLVRRAVRYVMIDELDNCEQAAGRLGSHLGLAAERTTTYGEAAKIVTVTTPSLPEAGAWRAWMESDRRQYYVPCPHCGTYQILIFEQIRYPEKRTPDEIEALNLARYACAGCEREIKPDRRQWMVIRGLWLPHGVTPISALPLDDAEAIKRAALFTREQWRPDTNGSWPTTRRRGYHIWSAYSPWRTWSMIAAEYLRTKDEDERRQVFVNSWLGEPYLNAVETTDIEVLRDKRLHGQPRDLVPSWAKRLMIGVDTQDEYLVYELRAWGENAQSTLIREGDLDDFAELEQLMYAAYDTESGSKMRVSWVAIDLAGHRTEEVYTFARTHQGVMPVRGMTPYAGDYWIVKPATVDYTPRGRRSPWTLRIWHVNVNYWKDTLHRFMARASGERGHWGLHRETSDAYLDQITAEHQTWEIGRTGRKHRVWRPKSQNRRTDFLDATIYGMAIAWFRGFLDMGREAPPPATVKGHRGGGRRRLPDRARVPVGRGARGRLPPQRGVPR